jgi:hypothetical protein
MKKFLSLLMLMPLIGFSQNLVTWDTNSPSNLASNISGQPLTTEGGISSEMNQWEAGGFLLMGFHNNAPMPTLSTSKYIEFKATPASGYKISPSQFNAYIATASDAPRKMQAMVSVNGTTWVNLTFNGQTEISLSQSQQYYSLVFPATYNVMPGETLRIRVYMYDFSNNYYTKVYLKTAAFSNTTSTPGPTLTGTVTPAGGVTAVADAKTMTQNGSVNINVLANDIATGTAFAAVTIDTPPASGTAVVQADKTIIYTPAAGYSGTATFKYKVKGADASTATATVTVTVNPFVGPTANADAATTGQNIPVTTTVLSNDITGDGTINEVTITGQPANGVATLNAKAIVYTPAATFTGTNTVNYKITDSNGKTSTAALTITVVAIQPAVANEDNATTAKNAAITLNVTANDTAGNSPITAVTVASNPAHGTVSENADKTITYTPDNNYTGLDSFSYTIKNGYNTTSTATVNITVLQPTSNGALCGTYYIGTNGDFTTITAAVNHLNQYGVTCPVTFLLKNNTYKNTGNGNGNNASLETFPITINQFNGSSLTNTVTFKPAPNKNVRIEAFRDPVTGEWTGVPAVFKLNGADNIIFDGSNIVNGTTRNLFVVNSSFAGPGNLSNDFTDRAVIWLASTDNTNGADNVTIKYLQIKQTYKNTADNYCVGIYSGNNAVTMSNEIAVGESYTANSKLTVTGNDFINVKQGIYVNGNSTFPSQNIVITQNDLGAENNQETIILPVTLNSVKGFEVSENLIYKLYRNTTAANLFSGGVYVTGNSSNGSIVKNNMRDLIRITEDANTFAGIVLSSTNSDSKILVANNFILDVSALGNGGGYSNGYGIIVDNGGGYKIYNNTVALTVNQPQGGYSSAFYVNSAATALDVRNNIFVNNQTNAATRRSAIMVNNDVDNLNAIFTHLDYNNYYSTDKIGYIANNQGLGITWFENPDFVATFSGWKSALNNTVNTANLNNKDAHSLNLNPAFISSTDLHLATGNSAMDNAGTPLASINKDIDGQIRNSVTPDMGADEFGAVTMPEPGAGTGVYCTSSTTWNGSTWSNGAPTSEKDVIFTGNYTQIGDVLYACSLYVEGTAQVNFINNSNAVVVHSVNVASTAALTFESSSNLIQVENTQNFGIVTVKRNSSKLKRLDYTLWGSPVSGSQTMLQFSPQTMTNRFYYYNTTTNQYMAYAAPQSTTFAKGQGYLIRVPNNHPENAATVYTGVFQGTPNNGNVYFPLTYISPSQSYNAVSNPYPSPISVTDFIDANIDNIEGTLYMWRKTNDPTKTSYSTITKIGYTANAAPGGTNELVSDPFEIDPSGVLNTAQGFLVKATGAQNIVFKNNMRKGVNSSKFFRLAANSSTGDRGIEANRIWLNVTNSTDAFSQTLVAYTPQGTKDYDNGIDGKALLDGTITLYSVIDDYSLAIQARPDFDSADVVALGFKTATAGDFKISLDHVDGLFLGAGQKIFLKDKTTGSLHNLSLNDYSFTSETGTFNNRFELVYTDGALGVDVPAVATKDVIVYRDLKQVKVQSPEEIESVSVYDMVGKLIYEKKNIGSAEFSTSDLNTAQQVLIVKVSLANTQVVSKKIMMN